MLLVPQKGIVRVEHNTGDPAASGGVGTSVTTGASASTKGSVAQLIASTAFDAYWIHVIASEYGASTAASEGALDILIGSATEEILIPNLLMGYCGGGGTTSRGPKEWAFPLYIPAGSRLAAQAAGARTSAAMRVAVFLYGGHGTPNFRVGTKVTTYGMGTVPNGTSITPGSPVATEGAWAQITASTSEDHFAFIPSFQPSADSSIGAGTPGIRQQIDIGIGSATEEQIGQWWFWEGNDEQCSGPHPPMPVFQDVPSGTRLVMRCAQTQASASAAHNGVIHAVS